MGELCRISVGMELGIIWYYLRIINCCEDTVGSFVANMISIERFLNE